MQFHFIISTEETGIYVRSITGKAHCIKVGTSTLTYENGKLNLRRTEELLQSVK